MSKNKGSQGNTSLNNLKQHLKSKTPANLYFFTGDEPFLIDYYVGELKKLVLQKDTAELNFNIFENRFNIDDLIDACETFPIFAEKRLVIVKDSGLFMSKSKKSTPSDEKDKEDGEDDEADDSIPQENKSQSTLIDYLPSISETICLIFIEQKVDKRLKIYKQIVKHGLALEFNKLKEYELVSWVVKGMGSAGKKITNEAAQYLVSICEPDMYTLRNEIFKIAAYVDPRQEVKIEDIKLLAIPTIKSVIFDLLDAVANKDTNKSLLILNDILTLKEPEQKILSMLSKQTGEILKLKMLMDKRASQQVINEVFKGKHPYALKVMTQQAYKMDIEYLKDILKGCVEAEMSYKKGIMEPRLAIELLLRKINS